MKNYRNQNFNGVKNQYPKESSRPKTQMQYPKPNYSRKLPQIEFRKEPIIIDNGEEELLKYFEEKPPSFSSVDIKVASKKDTETVLIGVNQMPLIERTPNSNESEDHKQIDINSDDQLKTQEEVKLDLRPRMIRGVLSTLYFLNPTSTFSTRWDVIYKTMMRDWRKFYADQFSVVNIRRAKIRNGLEKAIEDYVSTKFSQHAIEVQDELKFNICCLIFPKELISNKIDLFDEHSNQLKGKDRSKKVKRIKELHNYLYIFSMDKWEKFFEDEALKLIFEHYMESIEERIEGSFTMQKNREIYLAAWEVLKNKMHM